MSVLLALFVFLLNDIKANGKNFNVGDNWSLIGFRFKIRLIIDTHGVTSIKTKYYFIDLILLIMHMRSIIIYGIL